MLKENLAANVRRVRAKKRLTQEEVADRAGITPSYVSEIERGNKEPTLSVVEQLGKAFGVRPLALLKNP